MLKTGEDIEEVRRQMDALRFDFEDTVALDRLEYETELSEVKEKMLQMEQSAMIFELKSRIKAHNDDMLGHVQRFRSALLALNRNLDTRAELLLEDLMMSIMHNSVELRNPTKHIFVSDVACSMGYKFTRGKLAGVGVPIAKRYRQMTGEIPSKHSQFVDGKVNMVNSYTEESLSMIREEIRKAWGPP